MVIQNYLKYNNIYIKTTPIITGDKTYKSDIYGGTSGVIFYIPFFIT